MGGRGAVDQAGPLGRRPVQDHPDGGPGAFAEGLLAGRRAAPGQPEEAAAADPLAKLAQVGDLAEFRERVGGGGFFKLAWCGSPSCEEALGDGTGATIRVILDGQTPEEPCLVDGATATHVVLVARAY